MSVRVVFTEGGEPLNSLKLRSGNDELTTDEQGHLELPLSAGRTTLMVFHRDQWLRKTLTVSDGASVVLVDLEDKSPKEAKEAKERVEVSFSDVGRIELGERYVYDRVIGHGGMSVVIRAKDRLLNRKVAIKLLNQELQENDEAQHMFLTEARNLATLSHPYLVSVHDIIKIDQRAMMVMEYIRGENMERLLGKFKHGMPEHIALRLSTQFAQVLGYLHDEGIVHRDIKLANAMIRHDGTLKLIDFGLARKFDELYLRGTRVRGTPAYMSPEQIRGKELTPASDIYQLGVCMYEAFTGQLPFEQGDVSYAHVHEDAVHPMLVNTDMNPDIAALIIYCMKKSPDERPGSAKFIANQLKSISVRITEPPAQNTAEFFAANLSSLTHPSLPQMPYPNRVSESGLSLNIRSTPSAGIPVVKSDSLYDIHPSQSGLSLHPTQSEIAANKTGLKLGVLVGLIGVMCLVVALVMSIGDLEPTSTAAALTQPPTNVAALAPPSAPSEPTQPTTPAVADIAALPAAVAPVAVAPVAQPAAPTPEVKPVAKVAPAPPKAASKVARRPVRAAPKKPVAKVVRVEPTPVVKAAAKKPKPVAKSSKPAVKKSSGFFGEEKKKKSSSSGTFLPMN